MSKALIVSASGIRGIVGQGLTPEVAARYGAAFGTWLGRDGLPEGAEVLVGRDSRISGALLADALMAGLRAVGLDVRDMGIVPTPTGLLAVEETPAAVGAVLVTASHNPAVWNGLKLAGPEGRFLGTGAGGEVERIYREGPGYVAWDRVGARGIHEGAIERHLERILALPIVDRDHIAARGFRVVLDCVRGAGGPIMSALLGRLGCEVIEIDTEADGRFPRSPEPAAENLGGLRARVASEGADLGMAVDPDVDRLALVDERGVAIGEDWTLALAVELVAAREPGPVVTNLSSSRVIQDAASRVGAPFHHAPVGEAHVVARMREVGAVIGGEGNGGVIYPALHWTRDAPLAAALILQLLSEVEVPLGALMNARPRYRIVKRKVARGGLDTDALLSSLRAAAPEETTPDARDGLRLEWPDGRWVHVRPSGTEPILRVVAEAPQETEAEALVRWVEGLARARLSS